jgi:hypothetical protein
MRRSNRYMEAFKENGNLAGLATAFAASAALLSPLPLLAGLVGEAAYLLFVPDSHWYDKRLSRRFDAEVQRRRQELKTRTLDQIDPEMRDRFLHLETIRQQITTQTQDDQKWFREVLRKLDYLLEKFLLFAAKEVEFRRYLGGVWQEECSTRSTAGPRDARNQRVPIAPRSAGASALPSSRRVAQMVGEVQVSYDAEIADLQETRTAETDDNSKAVLEKRIDVLRQRREGVGKIGKILTNLQYQLALLEDTFGLINDQIRARSPEQVLADIDGVVYQTDSMTQLLEDLAPFNEMGQD